MDEEKTLSEYLKGLRRASRYKQDFVASQLNITRQTYSHYETGRIKPPAGKLYRLAKLYGVSVEGMLAYEDSCSPGEEAKQREAGKTAEMDCLPEEMREEDTDCSLETFLYHFGRLGRKDKMEIISLMKIKERINGKPEK